MPSRRYYIATAPVAYLNGKLAPVRVKCPNSTNPDAETVEGFMYGYRRRSNPGINRFGFRTACRNLTTHPYTAQEDENRTLFRLSLDAVYTHKKITPDWKTCLVEFDKQTRYTTPIGFAVATCRENGGEWPQEWTV